MSDAITTKARCNFTNYQSISMVPTTANNSQQQPTTANNSLTKINQSWQEVNIEDVTNISSKISDLYKKNSISRVK